MALSLAFRLAIVLTPVLYRVVTSTQPSNTSLLLQAIERAWRDLHDADKSSSEVEGTLNADGVESDPLFVVTDYSEPFELRKLQWRMSRAPSGGTVEDQVVCTFHFIRVSSGSPIAWTDSTELAAVETALGTYWTAIAVKHQAWLHTDQYRWYKDGPAFWQLNTAGDAFVPIPGNPAIRVTEVDAAGTGGGANNLPPQSACSITEKTSRRTAWGRFFLPFDDVASTTSAGRISTSAVDSLVSQSVTFYNACRTAGVVPVVFSIPKPARPTRGGGTLPAQGGKAYEVLSLQVDDLVDVIRSRRYSSPTYRKNTALT